MKSVQLFSAKWAENKGGKSRKGSHSVKTFI